METKMENKRIDERTIEDIIEEIRKKAKSYTPEWHFDTKNPDIGACIGLIFANQVKENIDRFNSRLRACHIAYLNMLGIQQQPAQPASMTAVFSPVAGYDSVLLEKGTAFLAASDSDLTSNVIFETCDKRYITSSLIKCIVAADKKECSQTVLYEHTQEWKSIDFHALDTKYKNKKHMILFHSSIFGIAGRKIEMHVQGNIHFGNAVKNHEYSLFYDSSEGTKEVKLLSCGKDSVAFLLKNPIIPPFDEDEASFTRLTVVQEKPSLTEVCFDDVTFVCAGLDAPPEFVSIEDLQQNVNSFALFGDVLRLYTVCYIGMEPYFQQKGAAITISFKISFAEHIYGKMPPEEEELRIIKRKKRYAAQETMAHAYAQRAAYEYFTPVGWKRLPINEPERCEQLWGDSSSGQGSICFTCPDDWIPSNIEGYCGRCIRIILLASEFCYLQPCVHHIPIVTDMRISFSYADYPQKPEQYMTGDAFQSDSKMLYDFPAKAFAASCVTADALYIGFDRAPKQGPISIYFRFRDERSFAGIPLKFEYFGIKGITQLQVEDETFGGSISGTIAFVPPKDWQETVIAGQSAYFLHVVDIFGRLREIKGDKPELVHIDVNGVKAVNLYKMEAIDFYVEQPSANMKFNLGVNNIYALDVWVNETDHFQKTDAMQLLREEPQNYKAEWDTLDHLKAFYVRWQETADFSITDNKRVYMVDRINSQLIFGDGVSTMIPKYVQDIAFQVEITVCSGIAGNVLSHALTGPLKAQDMIAKADNPYPAYGGCDMENISQAVFRGTHILSCSNKLITTADFEKEALTFSNRIAKVKCLTDKNGKLVLVLLMRDCDVNTGTYLSIKKALLKHIVKKCEMSIEAQDICIREPVYVALSVQLWVEVRNGTDIFSLQADVNKCLSDYLKTVSGNNGNGWNIGEIPKKDQILMKLHFLSEKVRIKNFVMNGHYSDENGTHDAEMESLRGNPYVVVKNGVHTVNVINNERF